MSKVKRTITFFPTIPLSIFPPDTLSVGQAPLANRYPLPGNEFNWVNQKPLFCHYFFGDLANSISSTVHHD